MDRRTFLSSAAALASFAALRPLASRAQAKPLAETKPLVFADMNSHIGILGGRATVIPGYEQFAQLEELLTRRGLKADDVRNVLGGNYPRVLAQTLKVRV